MSGASGRIAFCSCGANLPAKARFCGACGRPNARFARTRHRELRAADREHARRFLVVGVVYAGVLAAMLAVAELDLELTASLATAFGLDVVIGVAAALILGGGAFRHALGRMPGLEDLGLALAVPVVSLPIAFGWVALVAALVDEGAGEGELGIDLPLSTMILVMAVLPALVEEWLCRGVLWDAIRPVSTRGIAIVSTAIPFACMHLFNGGWVLELPHRFALGLILGWLRARTGSLAPCVLAHFAHNSIAIAIA